MAHMVQSIYFGHPINTYNTPLEAYLMNIISSAIPGWIIENPNQEHHQIGYQTWKERNGNGMSYYYEKVLPKCSAGIFLPFRDGKWGIGVYGEAEYLGQCRRPIYKITHEGVITLVQNIYEIPILSIEETRKRIRTESGETNPY